MTANKYRIIRVGEIIDYPDGKMVLSKWTFDASQTALPRTLAEMQPFVSHAEPLCEKAKRHGPKSCPPDHFLYGGWTLAELREIVQNAPLRNTAN